MRVYGEAYLFINFWMDFLSLLLAARLRRARFRGLRAAAGAALGAVYAVTAWFGSGGVRSVPALLTVLLTVALIAFGRAGFRLFPWVAGSALLLCGLADALLRRGVSGFAALAVCGLAALGCCLFRKNRRQGGDDACLLRIAYHGRQAEMTALRDSGNLLSDGITGLPVIVAPEKEAAHLLPDGARPGDPATLPVGWRLLPIRTAAGSGLVMCFHPDEVKLIQDGKARRIDAAVAVADFAEKKALVPEELFFR